MLRPATPLTVLLFASFVLLLLSVLSTPVIKGIPIAEFKDVYFGVFGYCEPDKCTGIGIGYTTDGVFDENSQDGDFSLPTSARHSLSALLVVHPIAAFFNLVCLGLAGAAHLHSPSHSARYLLGLLILLLPTLLVTLLAFLVDVLLFVPHLQWGGWIVLASTILITASGVVTCAMRRTLVSRKARKKRIAENAEMSGENFYSRQNTLPKTELGNSPTSAEPTMPAVNGTTVSDTVPILTSFGKDTGSVEARMDHNRRTPSRRTDPSHPMEYRPGYGDASGPRRSRSQDQSRSPHDGYQIPFPANGPSAAPWALHKSPSNPSLRQPSSRERMNGMPAGMRGGYSHRGQRGRGGYHPRGNHGPPGHGFGGPGGGMNAGYGRGGYHDGRGHYSEDGQGGGPAATFSTGMAAGAAMGRLPGAPQQAPPPTYPPQQRRLSGRRSGSREELRRNPSMGEIRSRSVGGAMRDPMPGMMPPLPHNGQVVGHAMESSAARRRINDQAATRPNETGAAPGTTMSPDTHGQVSPAVESHGGGYGAEDTHRHMHMPPPVQGLSNHSSTYSQGADAYIPPRSGWNSSSDNSSPNYSRPTLVAADPTLHSSSDKAESRPRATSSVYYEDVAPRFSETAAERPRPPTPPPALPRSLKAGRHSGGQADFFPPVSSDVNLPQQVPDGTRSPTGSDTSHYTSVSQRGVNPRWKPGSEDVRHMPQHEASVQRQPPGMDGAGAVRGRDVLLENNPDFAIPGMGPPRSGATWGQRGAGGAGPAAAATAASSRMAPPALSGANVGNGLSGVGRYPPPA